MSEPIKDATKLRDALAQGFLLCAAATADPARPADPDDLRLDLSRPFAIVEPSTVEDLDDMRFALVAATDMVRRLKQQLQEMRERVAKERNRRRTPQPRSRDDDPATTFRTELQLAYLKAFPREADRNTRPLGAYVVAESFIREFVQLPPRVRKRVELVCAIVACGATLPSMDVHPIRVSPGGKHSLVRREGDNATGQKAKVTQGTPGGWRLGYWKDDRGCVTFVSVRRHGQFSLPKK